MQTVICNGTPFEIGFQHGQAASKAIERGIIFYENLFKKTTKLSWEEVCHEAVKFLPVLNKDWAEYVEEMNGVSRGARVPSEHILALNVRTEIAFGMFSDGCTSISWTSSDYAMLAQNWDWHTEQSENLLHLQIRQSSRPQIDMITEAGIIGKIGLNSSGVGVCLNAIRARTVDFDRLPCHLALRACLDSNSKEKAVAKLRKAGVASSCHILIADLRGGVGLECSYRDIVELPMSNQGVVTHTNHYIKEHPGVDECVDLLDSPERLQRINYLLSTCDQPSLPKITAMLEDKQNYPTAINRGRTDKSTVATLFSIVMELDLKKATVKLPTSAGGAQEIFLDLSH